MKRVKVTAYKCSDGQVYASAQEAAKWEALFLLRELRIPGADQEALFQLADQETLFQFLPEFVKIWNEYQKHTKPKSSRPKKKKDREGGNPYPQQESAGAVATEKLQAGTL